MNRRPLLQSLVIAITILFTTASSASHSRPRRILRSTDNIGQHIKQARQQGGRGGRDRFTIHTEVQDGEGKGMDIAMDVIEVENTGVTPST